MSVRHLDRLFEPASVVVAGASDRVGSVGAIVWRNLRAAGFAGPIWPLNAKHATLDGEPVFARVADLPQPPDLAVLCVPPGAVAGLIGELGRFGARAAIVMTAGLSTLQKQAMRDAARPHVLRILGPDSLGLLTPHLGLNATFAHADALPGDVAFVSQSGALVAAVLDWAKSRRIGFSHLVSLGERADIDFGDLLDHLASDSRTRSILLYIESVEAPRKFMSAARAAARNKPVIVVKAGRADHDMRVADIVFDAAIRRAGMLRVDTLQDLFMAAETLARYRGHPGGQEGGLTLMTNSGGAGLMAADAAARAEMPLRTLGAPLLAQLDAVLPPNGPRGNPVDIGGDAPVQRCADTLRALLADPDTGPVLFMHAPTALVGSADIARACAPLAHQAAGRMMACWLGDSSVAEARQIFEAAGVANFETPEEAVRAFAMLATYHRNQALLTEAPTAGEASPPDTAAARGVIERALAEGRDRLDELEAREVLVAYGIPVTPTLAAGPTADAAAAVALALGYPLALKISSPDICHKSEVGGVCLNLRDEAELRDAVRQMLHRVGEAQPQACIRGFTVQPMARRPFAQELVVGASVDPVFGPVVFFGQGGTAFDVLVDRAIALPPLNHVLARELISRTRVARLLAGYRSHPPARVGAICDVLVALSQMLADLPELIELDINPLWADHDGVVALDARLRLSPATSKGTERFAIQPYPAQLGETVSWQGRELLLRPVRPEDEPRHRAFMELLEPEDLRLRFFCSRRELPRTELARLVQIDYAREMAFVALLAQPDGSTGIVGVVRAVADPDNFEAEFAIIVRSDLKGQGLGHLLLDKMVRYLRSRGTQRLVGDVLRENRAMRELARSTGLHGERNGSDGSAIRFVMDLAQAPAPPP